VTHYLGIDIGGTKIAGVVLNDAHDVIRSHQIATLRDDYTLFLKSLVQFIHELDLGEELPVGIGMPGALSLEDQLVKNSNIPCVRGQPLWSDLKTELSRPVRIENDANCFALSEAVDGAASGAEVVFGVILGTGTGGAWVVREQLLQGVNHIAGEWGHNPLPFVSAGDLPGPQCYCGQRGCIETYLSGPGLSRDHLEVTGVRSSAIEILEKAEKGEKEAIKSLDRHAERLSQALASIINVMDPQVIVMGGGVSQMMHLYEEVPKRWGKYVYSDTVRTELKPNKHGPTSGVRGAAWLWR
jgi:fructokinase